MNKEEKTVKLLDTLALVLFIAALVMLGIHIFLVKNGVLLFAALVCVLLGNIATIFKWKMRK